MLRKHIWPLLAASLLSTALVGAQARDNIIVIQTDDMTPGEMQYLPRTAAYLAANGTTFENAFVANSFCCPSRVSTLTGRYPHNTGVHENVGVNGGFSKFHSSGLESNTIATWLKSAGYTTAYFGKYLNGYGNPAASAPTFIPPGWDKWYALSGTIHYYNYRLNENGRIVSHGSAAADYATDVLARHARGTLDTFLAGSKPFFMMISPFAPHVTTNGAEDDEARLTAVPAPRHASLYPGLKAPRSPSFDEVANADKPSHIRSLPRLKASDIAYIDRSYRLRAQSLRAVDEMIGSLLDRLAADPAGDRTHIVFMSDNGYYFGDHRIVAGKGRLYDPAHRIPLAFAGPGVGKGVVRNDLALNIDIAPTLAALAGVSAPAAIDGRSLTPVLSGGVGTRRSMLLSWVRHGKGIRTANYAYYENRQGARPFRELYDMRTDPGQVNSIIDNLTPESAAALSTAVKNLDACAGAACRVLESDLGDALVVRAR